MNRLAAHLRGYVRWLGHEQAGRHCFVLPFGLIPLAFLGWLLFGWPEGWVVPTLVPYSVVDSLLTYRWWLQDTERAAAGE